MLRSQDYYVSEVEREPNVLSYGRPYTDAPHSYNKKVVYEEDNIEGSHHHHHRRHHYPETHERVEVIEYEQIPERRVGEVIYEENVNMVTDRYYAPRNTPMWR